MKAFFTVTEDSLSRRMGIFKSINGKGEEKNCQQSFTIFSIDVTGNASVFVFVFFFFKLLSYPCQQEPQYCRHGKS